MQLTNYEPVPSGLSFELDLRPPYPGRTYVLSTPGDEATIGIDGTGTWSVEALISTDGVNFTPYSSWTATVQWVLDTTDIQAIALRVASWSDGAVTVTLVHGVFASAGGGVTPEGAHHTTHETGGGDQIVSLPTSVLTSGTIATARLPTIPIANGGTGVTTGLTVLNASNLASGTVPIAQGGTGVTTGLTALSASALTSGTVPAAALSAANLPAHATRHQTGGADPLALDTLAAPTDVTTLNASTTAHGLLPKLPGTATTYLNGAGAYTVPAAKPFRVGHTWGIVGDLSALTTLPSIFVPLATAQAAILVSLRAKIASGTSVGVQVKKNGSNVGSVITVTTTVATTSLGSVSLSDADELTLVLSSPSGTPTTLSATAIVEHQP